MANTSQTYPIYVISPMTCAGSLTQSGTTVTVGFNGPSDWVWVGILPGDPLFIWYAVDPRYNGLWTIDTIDPVNGVATFTHTMSGLPTSSGGVQVGVAVVTTLVPTAFVPGVNVTISGSSVPIFNVPTTVRSVFQYSIWGSQFVVAYPQGNAYTDVSVNGSITGFISAPTGAPSITSFTASPGTVAAGSPSTLSWTTTGADNITLTPLGQVGQQAQIVAPSGSQVVTPGATTQYLLTATGSGSQAVSTVTVTVTGGVTATISASPTNIQSGQTSTLTWSTANAVSASISPVVGAVALSGTTAVSPTTSTTYTITAISASGAVAISQATVAVAGTVIAIKPVTTVPATHVLACTASNYAMGYIGDLLGQYNPYNLLASTRPQFALENLDLNGSNGGSSGSNLGADFVVRDDAGNLYFGMEAQSEGNYHYTKTNINPPGQLTIISRVGWVATATHDNGTAYTASKAIDGNVNTYWWSGANIPQTLTIDMGVSQAIDFVGILAGTAHTSDNPTSVAISLDGAAAIGTFALNTSLKENFIPIHAACQTIALQFTATVGGGWVEVAEVNAYLGANPPIPTFSRIASSDIIGVSVPGSTSGGFFACWSSFDKTILQNYQAVGYKIDSTTLAVISSGALPNTSGGNILQVGPTSTGQLVIAGGSTITTVTSAESDITITGVAVSGGNAVYSYSSITGPALLIGMPVTTTGFVTGGNNVTGRTITAIGAGTFTVATTTQVNETHAAAGVVPCFATVKSVALSAFGITGSVALDSAFFDPFNAAQAWLVVNNSTTGQTQVYHVNLNTTTLISGPGVMPVHNGWNITADPVDSTRLYGVNSSIGATLHMIDSTSYAITTCPLPVAAGSLVPDPAVQHSGVGYQKNTHISYVQGAQTNVYPGSVTSGHLLVVTYGVSGSVDPLTVTDTVGTVYTKAYASVGQPINIAVYYGVAAGTGANTVTIVGGTGGGLTQVAEFIGANAVNDVTPVDQYKNVPILQASSLALTINTASDWDFLLVVTANNGNSLNTPTPFSFPLAGSTGALGWEAASTAGHYSIGFSSGGGGFGHAIGAVLLALTPNSPTIVTTGGSVYKPVFSIVNNTDPTRNPGFLSTDQYTLSVTSAPPNAPIDIMVNGTWTRGFGTTDGSGNWSYSNTFLARSPAAYIQQFTQNFEALQINGFVTNAITFTVSTTGTPIALPGLTLSIVNYTDPSRNPMFVFTDNYHMSLTGAAPSSSVDINVNGGWTLGFGTTDVSGNWTHDGTWNDTALDVSYIIANPYSFVYCRVNGQLSTVLVIRVMFAQNGLVWFQGPDDLAHNGLWYGIDPLVGRVAQTMGVQPGLGNFSGSSNSNVGLVYTGALVSPLSAPTGILPSLSVIVGVNSVTTTSGGGGGTPGGPGGAGRGYITWHARGYDSALYVSDGFTGWYRMAATMPPEPGLAWSPFRLIVGGCSAVQSLETEPGSNNLLLGPSVATGPILKRDVNSFTDNSVAYASFATIGNIVLAQPGQQAGIRFITLDSRAKSAAGADNARPTVSVLLDEIAPTVAVPFELLALHVPDPPTLTASTTVYADRFYLGQVDLPAWCRHLQVKFDWAADGKDFELLSYTLFGKVEQEG